MLQADRPLPIYIRNPSAFEILILIFSAALSIAAGLVIARAFFIFNNSSLLLFLGVAHVLVFGTMLWFIRLGKYRALGNILLCIFFPICGMFFAAFSSVTLSYLIGLVVWGGILWHILEDPAPFLVMTIISASQLALLIMVVLLNDLETPKWYLPSMLIYWQVASSGCLVWCGLRYRKMLSDLSIEHCSECDYPFDGLRVVVTCPECGKPRALPIF